MISPPPIVLHVPHASTAIPSDVRDTFVISEPEMQQELLRLTDAFTDDLFTGKIPQVVAIIHQVSRFVVDPERFEDDVQEPMSQRGMGAVYTLTTRGSPLRRALSAAERQHLINTYYAPHHRALTQAVQTVLDQHSKCLIFDCHSFPSHPLPCDIDQHVPRTDICLGTDAYHTPDWLFEAFAARFQQAGYTVEKNRPYSGTLVPLTFYAANPRVLSIMIELNRRLYMDEQTGHRHQGYAGLDRLLAQILPDVATRFQKIEL
jgi:N-formylglutamate amidohydrolase